MGVGTVVRTLRLRYVIVKFSQMDSLPNFLTHGAPLESSAIMRDTKVENSRIKTLPACHLRSLMKSRQSHISISSNMSKNSFANLVHSYVQITASRDKDQDISPRIIENYVVRDESVLLDA